MLKRLSKQKEKSEQEELVFGDILLYPKQKSALCRDSELKLTNTEFSLITYMIEHKDKAVSREELLSVIWGYDNEVETRVTDDTIKRIRKKLSLVKSEVLIQTVWGFGFKLAKKESE